MNRKDQNLNRFRSKKSNLDQMVKHSFIEGDQAIVPCYVEKYTDIISNYSVKGYETLNPAFQDYMLDIIRFIPDEYSVMLEISGASFTAEEQEIICRTLRIDMLYHLGECEEQDQSAFRNFLWMVLGCFGMGVFLTVVNFMIEIAKEFFYIVFWFFADTLVRYLLHDRSQNRYNRLLAGRLASITVRFQNDANNDQ